MPYLRWPIHAVRDAPIIGGGLAFDRVHMWVGRGTHPHGPMCCRFLGSTKRAQSDVGGANQATEHVPKWGHIQGGLLLRQPDNECKIKTWTATVPREVREEIENIIGDYILDCWTLFIPCCLSFACDAHTNLSDLHTNLSDMHTDLSDLHANLSDLHTNLSDLHTNLSDLHTNLSH